MNRIKTQTPREEQFEPVWEEQYPSSERNLSADIVLRDILLDALRQF
jgi:hypothetical protein